MHKFSAALIVLAFSLTTFAATDESPEAKSGDTNPLRCEKFSEGGVATLKEKLGTHCNLDKPYSISVAATLATPDGFYYCCHKK